MRDAPGDRATSWPGRLVTAPAWLTAARGSAAIVTASALLAACGTLRAPGPSSASGQPRDGGGQAAGGQAAAGSRAQALALAKRMLERVVLPPGARRVQPARLPQPLRQPAAGTGAVDSVDVHRVFSLRQRMPAAYRFLKARRPAGMAPAGFGRAGRNRPGSPPPFGPHKPRIATVTTEYVSYSVRRLPPGIYQAELLTEVAPHGGGSLLRADAQVTWFPPRSAAERITPAAFRVLVVSADRFDQVPRTVTRTITSAAVIARFARILNSRPVAPGGVMHCPMINVTYRVAFAARAGARPAVVAVADGCATDTITVHGKAQPPLWDPADRLAVAVARLLGTPRRPLPAKTLPAKTVPAKTVPAKTVPAKTASFGLAGASGAVRAA